MKLGWFHYHLGLDDAQARGYFLVAFHIWSRLSEMDGVELVDIGTKNFKRSHWKRSTLDGVIHICPPHKFKAFEYAPNFLFSMCEVPGLDAEVVEKIKRAEYHFVPSTFCRDVWAKYDLDAEVVPLGIGPEFEAIDTTRRLIRGPDSPKLRFLYVGSNNPRKGWELVAPAFKEAFETGPGHDVSLYWKTFNDKVTQGTRRPYGDDRLILDTRDLETKDLAELYGSADVFIFPTFGEGFGLPVLEAMAAGCLTIAPLTGGLTDFFSSNTGIVLPKSKIETMNYGDTTWTEPVQTVNDLARAMFAAWKFWGTGPTEALRRTGTAIAREYTWDRSAKTLFGAILKKRGDEDGKDQIYREGRTNRSVSVS